MQNLIANLDEYFCETYAHYDKLCVLKGYKMPQMQTTKVDEWGNVNAYTLPLETMRLALQENKEELLKELKKGLVDKTFSFSFQPLTAFQRFVLLFSQETPKKALKEEVEKVGLTLDTAKDLLVIGEEVWSKIVKGAFLPTKNLVFSLALAAGLSFDATTRIMDACGMEWEYKKEKDVVVSYLLLNKVYNKDMMAAAFAEYKIENLYIK